MLKNILLLLALAFFSSSMMAQSKIDSLKSVLEQTTEKRERLTILDDLTKKLIRNNEDSQEFYLKEYIQLTHELTEFDLMASKSRFLIQYYINKGQIEKALGLCDSLLSFKAKYKKQNSEAHLLLKRAAAYYDKENLDPALEDYNRAAELFIKSGDSIFAADALFFGGQALADKNEFLKAILQYENAEKLYETLGDQQYSILVGSELTALYNKNGFVEKSIQERTRLIKKAKKNHDFISLGLLFSQNVAAYYKLERYDKMQFSIQKVLRARDSIEVPYYKFYCKIVALNYQLLHACKTNTIEDAEKYMIQLEKLTKTNVSPYLKTDVLSAKAAYYEAIGNENALIPILKSLSNIHATSRLNAQTKAREKLANILSKRGQYKEVAKLYEMNAKIKDSVYKVQKNNAFLYYQAEFETERRFREVLEKEAEIERLETLQQLAENKRNSIIVILVLFFIGITLIVYLKNKQKIKEQAYQNILLNNKVATKTEEINELLTETITHIKSKERIAENLEKLATKEEETSLKSIIADLKASKADDDKLMLIKQNIEQVNFEFIKKLKTLHPDLTKTDIEICSLIRVGLKRKEVANLRNTSLGAVKTFRFRLKKKLQLSSKDKLDDYIKSI